MLLKLFALAQMYFFFMLKQYLNSCEEMGWCSLERLQQLHKHYKTYMPHVARSLR